MITKEQAISIIKKEIYMRNVVFKNKEEVRLKKVKEMEDLKEFIEKNTKNNSIFDIEEFE